MIQKIRALLSAATLAAFPVNADVSTEAPCEWQPTLPSRLGVGRRRHTGPASESIDAWCSELGVSLDALCEGRTSGR
jgi:hypothetical protein